MITREEAVRESTAKWTDLAEGKKFVEHSCGFCTFSLEQELSCSECPMCPDVCGEATAKPRPLYWEWVNLRQSSNREGRVVLAKRILATIIERGKVWVDEEWTI